MPVMTTVQHIIDLMMSKSMKNQPGVIATDTELIRTVAKAQRGLYLFAARINPTFFADQEDVELVGGAWPRPGTAESVLRIEAGPGAATAAAVPIAAGTEIVVVRYDQRRAEAAKPAVYAYGQMYRAAGNVHDPAVGALTFFYARRPIDPNALLSTLDEMWPEQFNELLALEGAIYLAIKDTTPGREAEVVTLQADRDRWVQLFVAFLEHETIGTRQQYGHTHRFNAPTMVPLGQLLAGGSAAVAP